MGSLTDDMVRLCGEIVTMRHVRRAFVQDLVHNVAQLKAGFRQAHAQMAKETGEERAQAVFDLKVAVAGLRQDNVLDLKGARRAWFGPAPGEGRSQKKSEPQAPPKPKAHPGPAPEPGGRKVRQAAAATGKAAKRPPAKGGQAKGGKGTAGRGPKKSQG